MSNTNFHNSDLDDLKSLWKSQPQEKEYDSGEIFRMIQKKSINSVQWLFIISLVEMACGLTLSLWTFLYGLGISSSTQKHMSSEDLHKLENLSYFGLLFSAILIGIIYYYYRKIKSDMSVKQLISNIIIFRKTVIWYLILAVAVVLIFLLPIYYKLGKENVLNNVNFADSMTPEELSQLATSSGWFMAGITFLMVIIFTAVYYFIVYGYFLRKLNRDMRDLKEITE